VCRELISREPVERRTVHGMPSARSVRLRGPYTSERNRERAGGRWAEVTVKKNRWPRAQWAYVRLAVGKDYLSGVDISVSRARFFFIESSPCAYLGPLFVVGALRGCR
jgi:hypothetical protein